LKKLKKDGTWGGQVEIVALAHRFKFNAIVHQVGAPNTETFVHEPVGSVPTLHLSYHLGRHYNSVRRADDPELRKMSPTSGFYVVGHDLEKNKAYVDKYGPTRSEKRKLKEAARKAYKESLVNTISKNFHDYFGFLLP